MEVKSVTPLNNKCPRCGAIGGQLTKIKVMFYCANCLIHFDYRGIVFIVTRNGKLIKESIIKKEDEKMAYGDKMKLARELLPKDKFIKLMESGKTDDQIASDHKLETWLVKKLKIKYGLVQPRKKKEPQAAQPASPQPNKDKVGSGNKSIPARELLEKMVNKGISRKDIANYFGYKVAEFDEWMIHYGLKWPDPEIKEPLVQTPSSPPTEKEQKNNHVFDLELRSVARLVVTTVKSPDVIIHYAGTDKVDEFKNVDQALKHIEENCSKKQVEQLTLYQKVPISFGVMARPAGS